MSDVSILDFVKKEVADGLVGLEKQVRAQRNLNAQVQYLEGEGALTFTVRLDSLWDDHGEKDVTVQKKGSLALAVKEACAKFKQVNDRSDIQARWHVTVTIPGRPSPTIFTLPEKFWSHLKQA
jgi:hypothetical protein